MKWTGLGDTPLLNRTKVVHSGSTVQPNWILGFESIENKIKGKQNKNNNVT